MSLEEDTIVVAVDPRDIDLEKVKRVAPKVLSLVMGEGLSPVESQVLFSEMIKAIQKTNLGTEPCNCPKCTAMRKANKSEMN